MPDTVPIGIPPDEVDQRRWTAWQDVSAADYRQFFPITVSNEDRDNLQSFRVRACLNAREFDVPNEVGIEEVLAKQHDRYFGCIDLGLDGRPEQFAGNQVGIVPNLDVFSRQG